MLHVGVDILKAASTTGTAKRPFAIDQPAHGLVGSPADQFLHGLPIPLPRQGLQLGHVSARVLRNPSPLGVRQRRFS
jgi:hypothetical protein